MDSFKAFLKEFQSTGSTTRTRTIAIKSHYKQDYDKKYIIAAYGLAYG